MSKVYMYVVDRDFGFAPNPFHGFLTLATCKPNIRRNAKCGDWVVGMGGARLKATGKCIFSMKVTEKITFDEYWSDARFFDKKPVRNGSRVMMVGDNIYHRATTSAWSQSDSHHSNADGSINYHNLNRDTEADAVLISRHFFYFGVAAPLVPKLLIELVGYKNGIGHRVYDSEICGPMIDWIYGEFRQSLNIVEGDPFDFEKSDQRYAGKGSKLTTA